MLLEKLFAILAASTTLLTSSMNVAIPDNNINGNLMLVNNQRMISKAYIPEVRKVAVYGMSQSMREEAAIALEALFEQASKEGIMLSSVSGYRSYTSQNTIYSRKVDSYGQKHADLYSAKPGTSEHQLGLVMDVSKKESSSLHPSFADTPQGIWIAENAHEFGFIIRYLKGYEEVTGIQYEPWHLRYVGNPYATAIYTSKLPMELFFNDYRLQIYEYLINTNTILNEVT